MLGYRRDIVEELGIDVEKIETWDDFVKMGREITRDLDGDGNIDRYALELRTNSYQDLTMMMLQNGGGIFNAQGELILESKQNAKTLAWIVEQSRGPNRISFSAGAGQTLAKTVMDGLVVFYLLPDWRSKFFEMNIPEVSGKMALMPVPAWHKGGVRTSTLGGTGMCITKQCANQELAWELAKYLYLTVDDLNERFENLNILSPLKEAWKSDAFHQPNAYYSNQPLGKLYAELATEVPDSYVSPYTQLAMTKVSEVYQNGAIYFDKHDTEGLQEYITTELTRVSDYLRKVMARNRFMRDGKEANSSSNQAG
jgi:arabinosaccharide transport system substrate-binding protein